MSNILGKYTLTANLDDFFNNYQLTGNNRNAQITGSQDVGLTFEMKFAKGDSILRTVNFISANKIKIERVRLITPGCKGLRASPNQPAANLNFISIGGGDSGKKLFIQIQNFNEWEKVNCDYWTFESIDSYNYRFNLEYANGSTVLNIDDYNIDTPYVGESVHAILEMEIDTAGLYDGVGVV